MCSICFIDAGWFNADENVSESHKEVKTSQPENKSGTGGSSARKRKKDKKQVCEFVSRSQPHTDLSLFSISFFQSSNLRLCVSENLIILVMVPNLIFEVLCSFRAWRRVPHK